LSLNFHLCTHRRLPNLVIYMETALQCYNWRATPLPAQGNREMLELLIKRFGSKLQRSLHSSLSWSQTRSSSLGMASTTNSRLLMRVSKAGIWSTREDRTKLEKAFTNVPSGQNGSTQPLVTPITHLWEAVPLYDLTPPSPFQKRQLLKPSLRELDKSGAENHIITDWNKIRRTNESNFSLASQMSSMSTMSFYNGGSSKNYITLNLASTRSRHSAER
jgi:hypothetical protein